MEQMKDMDEQIIIRDKLIRDATLMLQKMHVSSLFNNSMLVKNPYGICLDELSDIENFTKKSGLKRFNNYSLPQLEAYKGDEEEEGTTKIKLYLDLTPKVVHDGPSTPKQLVKLHQQTNSSFDSPYLKNRKKEIDDIASKYFGFSAPSKQLFRVRGNS